MCLSKLEGAERPTGQQKEQREPRAVSRPFPLLPALQGPPTSLSPCQGTQQPHHYSAGPLTPTHSGAWACSIPPFKLGSYQGGLWVLLPGLSQPRGSQAGAVLEEGEEAWVTAAKRTLAGMETKPHRAEV